MLKTLAAVALAALLTACGGGGSEGNYTAAPNVEVCNPDETDNCKGTYGAYRYAYWVEGAGSYVFAQAPVTDFRAMFPAAGPIAVETVWASRPQ